MNNNNCTQKIDSYVYYILLSYILLLFIEGPLRYILYLYGTTYLLYIRDFIIIIIIAGYICQSLFTFKINRMFIIVIIIFIFHSIVALFFVDNYLMPFFAWKTYLGLFLGILYGSLLFTNLRLTVRVFTVLLICGVIGVFINYFIEFPWEGLEYRLGGVDIEGVRSWVDMFGLKRLSGFARTSFDAAAQALLLAVFLFCYLKNSFAKLLIWLLVAPVLFLTTTKGILLTYLLLTIFFLIYRIIPNYYHIYQKLLFVLLAIAIIMPVLSIFGPIYHDVPLFLKSFYMRIEGSWPDVFKLVQQDGSLLLGRGLGGMGSSQVYFEAPKYNPGDNIFLLFYGNLGLFGIVYLIYLAKLGQSLDLKTELFYYLFIFSFLSYGIVTSCIDNALFCLFLGVFLGYVSNDELRTANQK